MFSCKLFPNSTKFLAVNFVRRLPRGSRNIPSVGGNDYDGETKWLKEKFKNFSESRFSDPNIRFDTNASRNFPPERRFADSDKDELFNDNYEDQESPSPYDVDNDDPEKEAKMKRFQFMRRGEIPVEEETLLTWAAMDQIRQLHREDPSLWNPEKIADSFPISVEGARRFLRSRPPPLVTPEIIKKHDLEVEDRWRAIKNGTPGIVSEKTLFLLEQGLIKYLPMRSFDERKSSEEFSDEKKIRVKMDESEIYPTDGPFTKLYKRHLQWKNASKLDGENVAPKSLENNEEMIVNSKELLRSVIFSNNENDKNSDRMRYEDFQALMKTRLRSSGNRLDQKYSQWSENRNKNQRR